MDVWWIVGLSVVIVLVSILIFRLHAFLTLLLAGLLVAGMTSTSALSDYAHVQVDSGKMTSVEAAQFVDSSAPTRLTMAFGETAGKIGILIALASVIGQCLLESGAAATIVDRMLKLTGPKRAPEALAVSSFVIGIPVFFDTVFYLMVPLARSLRQRVGKNYVLFLMAILAGGSIAHSLVPPTPGPLQVAEIIGVDIGVMMLAGLSIGGCSSVLALMAARVINHFVDVPLRFDDDGEPIDATNVDRLDPGAKTTPPPTDTLETKDVSRADQVDADATGPTFVASILPIVVPVVLITIGSILAYLVKSDSVESTTVTRFFRMMGDKNIAIAFGVVFAMTLMRYCSKAKRKTLISRSLNAAGSIILITAAGGAFGAMLRQAGIAAAVGQMADGVPGLMLLPLAFAVTASIRTLQGSATVAMITAAGVLQGFAHAEGLPFHPVYLCMAIGAGSKPVSWMTDSAFWVITRMSGMTEAEGLKTLPAMSTSMGVCALGFTMLFAKFIPGI
ncbi:MAG: gluconate permease [Pirellulaceae bacterium]|nr:gluconate permease [Pirellulaceae bacterium]